jgi:hypothetical protein
MEHLEEIAMNESAIETVRNVNKQIFECNICSFHKEMAEQDLPYRCETFFYEPKTDYKAIAIGLNPGWNEKNDCDYESRLKEIYRKGDYDAYEKALKAPGENNKTPVGNHQKKLTRLFEAMNMHLKIYPETKFNRVYDFLFWANLACCSSQNVDSRMFAGKRIKDCNTRKEIHNCLQQGYLKTVIGALKIEYLLFFGKRDLNECYDLLKDLLNVQKDDIDHHKVTKNAQVRKGKPIGCEVHAFKLKGMGKRALFWPHTRYAYSNKFINEVVEDVCAWYQYK